MKFLCKKCGETEVFFTFADGTSPYCEECCPDHDYEYDRDRQGHFCKSCDQQAPLDWYED